MSIRDEGRPPFQSASQHVWVMTSTFGISMEVTKSNRNKYTIAVHSNWFNKIISNCSVHDVRNVVDGLYERCVSKYEEINYDMLSLLNR